MVVAIAWGMRAGASSNLNRRWAAVWEVLVRESEFDDYRIHCRMRVWGAPAKRFVVTAWERRGLDGLRGALLVVRALAARGRRIESFRIPVGCTYLEVISRSNGGTRNVLPMPGTTLGGSSTRVDWMVKARLDRPAGTTELFQAPRRPTLDLRVTA